MQAHKQAHWWRPRPSWLAWLLRPLSWLWAAGSALSRWQHAPGTAAPVPVVVVGNLVVGGTGKTPAAISLVHALRQAGYTPGVISRGHGGRAAGTTAVTPTSDAALVGDEPVLLARRTGAPMVVGRDRLAAVRALCAAHPQVDVLVSDDGLQHHRLAHQAALVLFDARGMGNGGLLPAGPLRQRAPRPWPAHWHVVYSGCEPSTALPGWTAHRSLRQAVPLSSWAAGTQEGAIQLGQLARLAQTDLRDQPPPPNTAATAFAVAGIGAPQVFFDALREQGVQFTALPQADHASYAHHLPWPATARHVVVTEKDAVKLVGRSFAPAQVWVVPLDCALPNEAVQAVLSHLPRPRPLAPP